MIKTIKASKSEKILFMFLIGLSIFAFSSFFLLKNKCLFVEKNNLSKLNFNNPDNIVVMNVECGNVIIPTPARPAQAPLIKKTRMVWIF